MNSQVLQPVPPAELRLCRHQRQSSSHLRLSWGDLAHQIIMRGKGWGHRTSPVQIPAQPLAGCVEASALPGLCLGFLECEMRIMVALSPSTVRRTCC